MPATCRHSALTPVSHTHISTVQPCVG